MNTEAIHQLHRRRAAQTYLNGLAASEKNVINNPPVFNHPNAWAADYEAAALIGMLIRDGSQLLDDEGEPTVEALELATRLHPRKPHFILRTAFVLAVQYEEIRLTIEHKSSEADAADLDHIAALNAEPASFYVCGFPDGTFLQGPDGLPWRAFDVTGDLSGKIVGIDLPQLAHS